ncbi:MAG: uracil phosphoribosyltransferase [Chloroflexota bacterium]|nr:MAG: uracil phosphoribosyltransferase [Chloroflexota bacterium]
MPGPLSRTRKPGIGTSFSGYAGRHEVQDHQVQCLLIRSGRAVPVYASRHPLARDMVSRLRSTDTDSAAFRALTRELATILTYEATIDLPLDPISVRTPLAETRGERLAARIGLVPILRAGLGMVDGALALLPRAAVFHLGFYRDETTLRPISYYNKLPPSPPVDMCLVLDPMLATGGSIAAAIDALVESGIQRISVLALIAAPEGLAAVGSRHPTIDIHVAAIDDRLNDRGYIIPGLGDAGDRLYGTP